MLSPAPWWGNDRRIYNLSFTRRAWKLQKLFCQFGDGQRRYEWPQSKRNCIPACGGYDAGKRLFSNCMGYWRIGRFRSVAWQCVTDAIHLQAHGTANIIPWFGWFCKAEIYQAPARLFQIHLVWRAFRNPRTEYRPQRATERYAWQWRF